MKHRTSTAVHAIKLVSQKFLLNFLPRKTRTLGTVEIEGSFLPVSQVHKWR